MGDTGSFSDKDNCPLSAVIGEGACSFMELNKDQEYKKNMKQSMLSSVTSSKYSLAFLKV